MYIISHAFCHFFVSFQLYTCYEHNIHATHHTDVDWNNHQCVQNCNTNNIDQLSCGGRIKNIPDAEVFDTPEACCYEMLSFLPLNECIKTCPNEYEADEQYYDELDLVQINDVVYQCKVWPENQYCNMFAPNFEVRAAAGVSSDGEVHTPNLGWTKLGTCDNENGFILSAEAGGAIEAEELNMMMMSDSSAAFDDDDDDDYDDDEYTDSTDSSSFASLRMQRKRQKYERKKEKKQRQKQMRQQSYYSSNSITPTTRNTNTHHGYILSATDDAHIYKEDPNKNGDYPILLVDNSRSASDHDEDVEILLKFDVSNINTNKLEEAILQLVPIEYDCEEELNIEVLSGGQTWKEDEVTWLNAPERAGPVSVQPTMSEYTYLPQNKWFNADVTNAILWSIQYRGQTYVTFRISIIGYAGTASRRTSSSCILASKEYMDGRYAPSLEVRSSGSSGQEGGGGVAYYEHDKSNVSQQQDESNEFQQDVAPSSSSEEEEEHDYHTWHGKKHEGWEPIIRSNTQHLWHVDYSLGNEGGECVRNCKGSDPNCGGGAAVRDWWLDLYSTPEECCEKTLWWMSMRQCVPGLHI